MLYINLPCICCWRKKYFTKQTDWWSSSFQLTFFSPMFSGFFVVKSSQKGALPGSETQGPAFGESAPVTSNVEKGKFEICILLISTTVGQLGVLWSLELEAILTISKRNNVNKNQNVFFRMLFNLIYTHQNPWLHVMPFPPVVPGTFLRVAWQKRFIGCHRIFVSIVCSEQKKHHSNRSNEGLLLPKNC